MFPIQEQGSGKGIGHSLGSFLERFDTICKEHTEQDRARAFAFIFYNFSDQHLRRILKDQGAFAKLDRLAGQDLTVFYLNSGSQDAVMTFNSMFFTALKLEEKAKPPCVVFFKLRRDHVEQIVVAQLNNAELIHGFKELYEVIERYIRSDKDNAKVVLKSLSWIRSTLRFLSIEGFRVALRRGLEGLL